MASRAATIQGLRALADWMEENPAIPVDQVTCQLSGHTAAEFRTSVRAMPGMREKSAFVDHLFVHCKAFPGINLYVGVRQDQVCTRKIRTETVVVRKPDPVLVAKVPEVEVEEVRQIEEWDCGDAILDDAARDESDRAAEREAVHAVHSQD